MHFLASRDGSAYWTACLAGSSGWGRRILVGRVARFPLARGLAFVGANWLGVVGIMRAEWKTNDLENAARNQLGFTPKQATL